VAFDAEVSMQEAAGSRQQAASSRQEAAGKNEPPRHEDTKKNK